MLKAYPGLPPEGWGVALEVMAYLQLMIDRDGVEDAEIEYLYQIFGDK